MPKRKRAEVARIGWKRKGEIDVSREREPSCSGVSKPKQCKLGDNELMVLEIEAVKDGKTGVNCAAREYGVPRTTLKDRLLGRVENGKNPGHHPYLTAQEEDELAAFLKKAAQVGYGKTKREVLLILQKALEQTNNKPDKFNGDGWYHRFMQRHCLNVWLTHCHMPDPLQ